MRIIFSKNNSSLLEFFIKRRKNSFDLRSEDREVYRNGHFGASERSI